MYNISSGHFWKSMEYGKIRYQDNILHSNQVPHIILRAVTSYEWKKKQTAEERSSFCKILGKWDSNHLAGARTHLIKPKATTKVLKEHVTILLAKMSLKF